MRLPPKKPGRAASRARSGEAPRRAPTERVPQDASLAVKITGLAPSGYGNRRKAEGGGSRPARAALLERIERASARALSSTGSAAATIGVTR